MTAVTDAGAFHNRVWRNHLLGLGAILLLIIAEFRDTLGAAVEVWSSSPTYSHCFLILPISAWLIWERREALIRLEPTVAPRFLWLVPPLVILWWLGELSGINEVRQYAIVALAQVMILSLLGVQVLRLIWFPVLFLLFLVPTGEYLIFPMQKFATRFVDIFLNFLRIPHYVEGTTFELTTGRFEIAEACAGLRFLVATVTLGALVAYLMYTKLYKVVLFLLASVLIPLIGNGLRCVGIILLAHFTNNKYGVGADHIVYGWGFNVALLLILIYLGSLFRDEQHDIELPQITRSERDTSRQLVTVVVAAAFLLSTGPAFALWRQSRPAVPDLAAITDYLKSAGWGVEQDANWAPHFPSADAQLQLALTGEHATSPPIEMFIGYYARPRAGHSVTAHQNLAWDSEIWNEVSAEKTSAQFGDRTMVIEETVIAAGSQRRLIWSTYWVSDRFTLSLLSVKLLQAQASIEGKEGQAFVAFSTPMNGSLEEARARLSGGLSGLGKLSDALAHANAGAPKGA